MKLEPNDASVLAYLQANPAFLERHAELLSELKLRHPQTGVAISLAERQTLVLRDKLRALAMRQAELVRLAQEQDHLNARLYAWARALLLVRHVTDLPGIMIQEAKRSFALDAVAVRVWDVDARWAEQAWAQPVSARVRQLADELRLPYCGALRGSEAAELLQGEGSETLASIAVLPLRTGTTANAFGVLVFAAQDPKRFVPDLGTTFLERLAELSSAALSRVRDPMRTSAGVNGGVTVDPGRSP